MAVFTFLALASVLHSASCVELFMSTTHGQIVSYDIGTKWIHAYSVNTLNYDISGGAIICNDKYYANYEVFDTDHYDSGIFSFGNISTPNDNHAFASYKMSEDDWTYLAFSCTETPNVLLAGAVYQDTLMHYRYSLLRLTFNTQDSTCKVQQIGMFNPSEYDGGPPPQSVNVFSFNIANNELFAIFPLSEDANLRIMDITSGLVRNEYRFPGGGSDGFLYFTLAQTLSGSTFLGAVAERFDGLNATYIDFVSLTMNDTSRELSFKTLITNDSYLKNSGGSSMAFCDDTGYVLVEDDPNSVISSFNVSNGTMTNLFSFDSVNYRAVACFIPHRS